ncbi:MAG: DUF4350 domain-containing protein [Bacteroidota bacterium]
MRARMIVLGVIGVMFLLLILSMFTGPDRINWRETFSQGDKNPYGAYVLLKLLPDLFPEGEITISNNETYYAFDEEYHENTAYIVLTNKYLGDVYDTEALLEFVEDGNYAFLVARDFPYVLKDSFRIRLTTPVLEFLEEDTPKADSTQIRFTNPSLGNYTAFDFKRADEKWYFEFEEEAENISVLAYNQYNKACLIKIPHGDGFLILGTSPRMFTNYFLLYEDNHRFAEAAFSYLPEDAEIIWDEFYKRGNYSLNRPEQEDPDLLAYIRSQRSLNWAYWLVAFAVLAYVIFESKRKQRVIPDRKPLPNATLEFTETVGRLYYQSNDHKNVAEKKIKILLAYIRTQYFLKTTEFSPEFVETLAGKSGMDQNEVRTLCRMIERTRQREQISESDLLELNLLVESFYLHANGRQ